MNKLATGTILIGKWQKQRYEIIRELGSGMIGTVYLCRAHTQLVALKLSEQTLALTREANILRQLNEVQDNYLGPSLFEIDDWQSESKINYTFYVMEYIVGEDLTSFMHNAGAEWIGVILIQLLDQLTIIHQAGFVFGDLKNDNIIIERSTNNVRLIDVGGVTKLNQSIKEYSNFYDRAYWGLGNRKAEPSYDLFSIVMVVLTIFYPQQFKKQQSDNFSFISAKVKEPASLALYVKILQKAIKGDYRTAEVMKRSLLQNILLKRGVNKRKGKKKRWVEISLIIILTGVIQLLRFWLV